MGQAREADGGHWVTMLASQSIHFVDSDYTTDLRNALKTSGGSQYIDLQLAQGAQSVGPAKVFIASVRLLTLQNLDWRVEFWDQSLPLATGVNLNNHGLLYTANMLKVTAASQYGTTYAYFNYPSPPVPYHDRQGLGQLHCNLVNLDGTNTKSAGDVGAVHLRIGVIFAS